MFIQTETTPNDASLKFIPGVEVTTTGTYEFLDLRSALPSPLATRLLSIDGLTGVFFGPDFVTCSKDDSFSWPLLKPEIFATMMEHFSSGAPLFRDGEDVGGAEDTRILESDSEVVAMVKELLETRVRPAIQEDGGDIEYKGLDEGTGMVKLRLKGSCRGCSSSSVTLKNGIERMLMHYVPEVKGVEQVSPHFATIGLAHSLHRSWMRRRGSHWTSSPNLKPSWRRKRRRRRRPHPSECFHVWDRDTH